MQLSHIINDSVPVTTGKNLVILNEEIRPVLAARGNRVYAAESARLRLSTDDGQSWVDVHDLGSGAYFNLAHITYNGVVLAFTNDKRLFRSTDGTTFSQVNTDNLGTIEKPLYHGIDSNGDIIILAEYALDAGIRRIIRSNDGGATWTVRLSLNAPDEIRHWHSVNFNKSDRNWYATSGDSGSQVKWFKSTDNGVNWTEISGVAGQKWRTLNLHFINDDEVIWSSDAQGGHGAIGIYKAPMTDFTKVTRLLHLPSSSFGLIGIADKLICITSMETGDDLRKAYIYSSVDGGNTWVEEISAFISDDKTNGGFRAIYSQTYDGSFWIYGFNFKNHPSSIRVAFK